MHARSAGSFKILTKLNDNAYIINLHIDFEISPTFNIENLVDYMSHNFNPSNPLVDEPYPEPFFERPPLPSLPNINPNTTEKIDKILNDEIIYNIGGKTRRYLVCWKGE